MPVADGARLEALRAAGGLSVRFVEQGGITRLADLAEHGGWRMKFPAPCCQFAEAVSINTGGGIAGGDRVQVRIAAEPNADVIATTSAAERVYRSTGGEAHINTTLSVGSNARLAWLPQETILYDRARLRRRIEADVAPGARLLVAEIVVLGRLASGERMTSGLLEDRWRVRRGGRLVLADCIRLNGDIATLVERTAICDGRPVQAMLVSVGQEHMIDAIRHAIAQSPGVDAAASAWNGLLCVRAIGPETRHVRDLIAAVAQLLTDRAMPRAWQI
jgi:urease accessory protein